MHIHRQGAGWVPLWNRVHQVGIALTDGVASSDAIIIRPVHSQLLPLILMTTSSDGFVAVTAQQMKEGSKMPRADWKQMQQYPVPLPPDGLLRAFNDFIDPPELRAYPRIKY